MFREKLAGKHNPECFFHNILAQTQFPLTLDKDDGICYQVRLAVPMGICVSHQILDSMYYVADGDGQSAYIG